MHQLLQYWRDVLRTDLAGFADPGTSVEITVNGRDLSAKWQLRSLKVVVPMPRPDEDRALVPPNPDVQADEPPLMRELSAPPPPPPPRPDAAVAAPKPKRPSVPAIPNAGSASTGSASAGSAGTGSANAGSANTGSAASGGATGGAGSDDMGSAQ